MRSAVTLLFNWLKWLAGSQEVPVVGWIKATNGTREAWRERYM